MRNLIEYFIKYPVSGNVLMMLILIFGTVSLLNLKSTLFPENESRIISIQTIYPGASPEEVENGIVVKIEDNLKGVTGVERVSSVSQENSGNITVEVIKGYDTDIVLQDVKNAVDQINSFPVGMEPPVIFKQEGRNFAYSFAITGDVDLGILKRAARKAEDELRAMEGVTQVQLSGFPDEEIVVSIREEDMRRYELNFNQVADAVRKANVELTGGTVRTEGEELQIRANMKRYYADELQDVIVKSAPDGKNVLLRDVADVADKWSERTNASYYNGEQAVIVTLNYRVGEDIRSIAQNGKDYLAKFNDENDVLQAYEVLDGTRNLNERIDVLTYNGLLGFILVLIVLTLFLNIRMAFWVAVAIPISFAGMFILSIWTGLTINVISLFGMILVIGILVDDGIVIGENIYQHYERGMRPLEAAVKGTMQVLPAVTSAILTTIVAFSTFYFLDGRIGDFGPDLAFVVIAALTFSLIEGALILPGHLAHSKALHTKVKQNRFEQTTSRVMEFMREKWYAPLLRFSLNNRLITFGGFFFLLMLTVGMLRGGFIKATFFPFIERDSIAIDVEMPPGTRDTKTQEVIQRIESATWAANEHFKSQREDGLDVVTKVQSTLGPLSNQGKINIRLLKSEILDMQSFIIANKIRELTGPVYEAQNISFGGGQPFGKPVSVSLLGNDLGELESAKEELKAEMLSLSSLTDVVDTDKRGIKEVNVRLKEKAHLLGLTTQDVVSQIRQGFFGNEVQRLQRGLDEVKLWIRYAEEDRSSLGKLEDMRIRTQSGQSIPLREIAHYEIERGMLAINHLDGKREYRLEADLSNPRESAVDIMTDLEEGKVAEIMAKYPTVSYSFEGQSKQSEKTAKSGKKTLPVILTLMLAIITLTFRSFPQAFIIMVLVIPFGFIGVGWGHFIHGANISLLSGFGIIALIGIMVNDSLVLVTKYNGFLKEGTPVYEALYKAGIARFRAIVLTSFTTIAGLAPLILERSFQAQFLIPMAIAVAYGMAIATFTTLILLPVLLLAWNDVKVLAVNLWNGVAPSREEVEPAVIEKKVEDEYS
jgi:multidrug efflux pump subunit AcrB